MSQQSSEMNAEVKRYWEKEPCGTHGYVVKDAEKFSLDYFESVESYRYQVEPFIHSIAQFTRYRGQRVLEVGVGAGTDHLQWARGGAELYGVDLTDAAIETTSKRLDLYGFKSQLQRVDAETLPFEDCTFDVVYSWGVIHHSEHPERILAEINRILKKGGVYIGMFYHRLSLTTLRVWLKHALLKGRPWRSFSDVLFHHVESIGTKAYSRKELEALFAEFGDLELTPLLTVGDTHRLPAGLIPLIPNQLGWFWGIRARKGGNDST